MSRTRDLKSKIIDLRAFCRREGRMPGYAEMLTLFGYRSKNAVHGLLNRLVALGYLRRTGRHVAPTGQLLGALRLLGTVAAGFPSPAEEELADTMNLNDFLVRNPEATFLLTVTGDSMIDAGIQPGDLVLIEKGCTPKNNDIVIAQVDGEWTLKYYIPERGGGIRLEPANRKYTTIRAKQSLVVGGVVRAVIRKYA